MGGLQSGEERKRLRCREGLSSILKNSRGARDRSRLEIAQETRSRGWSMVKRWEIETKGLCWRGKQGGKAKGLAVDRFAICPGREGRT